MKKLISISSIILSILFISMKLNAQITLSGTTGLDGVYSSLTNTGGVFSALNGGGSQTGNVITALVTADIAGELGTFTINPGDWASITITPSGARTVSGTVSIGMIRVTGADFVTIDGLNTGGNSLTISNLSTNSTTGNSTISFTNGATNNVITNCTILGSSLNQLGTPGGTIYFGTDVVSGGGNDANTISNCNIGPATATEPFKAILSSGSTGTNAVRNSSNLITNNNIFDFFGLGTTSSAGINIANGNDGWTISFNKIYQSAPRVFTTTGQRYSGIILNTTTLPGSFTVSNNIIGFANSAGTGVTAISGSSNEFRGIDAPSTSSTSLTDIAGNIISGITQTSSRASSVVTSSVFCAISTGTVDGLANVTGNTIGSLDGSSTIVITATSTTANTTPVLGIFNFSSLSTNIIDNEIGNITIMGSGTRTGFRGILVDTDVSPIYAVIQDNVISNIADSQVGSYTVHGIQNFGPDATILNNEVRNMTGNSTISNSVLLSGIQCYGTTGVSNIEKNKVYNLKNLGGNSAYVYGIDMSLPATANEVKQNYIYGFIIDFFLYGFRDLGNSQKDRRKRDCIQQYGELRS